MIWETVRDLLITAMAAAISENLVFVRAFSLGELDYEEYTIRRGLRDSRIVTLMCLLAAVSGWAGRQVIDRWFPLPPHLRPSVFLAIFATLFLCIMGGILLARKKRGKETSKKRYKFHTAIAFGFLPMGVLLVVGFGNGNLATSLVGAAGSGVGGTPADSPPALVFRQAVVLLFPKKKSPAVPAASGREPAGLFLPWGIVL